jgi:4-amino-4-deoxychorismate lyase
VVIADDIDYSFKYSDRSALTRLIDKSIADDILIIKNRQVTDTSYSNIAFTDGQKWFTPSNPLLKGTMRAKLINEGIISEIEISPAQISGFSHFRLINAMLGFNAPILSVSVIVV